MESHHWFSFAATDEHPESTDDTVSDSRMDGHASGTPARPPLQRDVNNASGIGGVARGVSRWLGVEVNTVRLAFAIGALFNGIGLLLYAILWAVLPDARGSVPARKVGIQIDTTRHDPVMVAAFGCTVTGAVLLLRQTALWFPASYVWPLVAMAVGLGVVWQPHRAARGTGFASGRLITGAILVGIGFISLFGRGRSFAASRQMLLDTVVVLAGIALLVGPLFTRLIRDLRAEENRRATSEAKADVAAHLHDSVLQSLALIQKRADSPGEVVTIARRQERELREWLYGSPRQPDASLKAALELAATDLEADHGVPIDIVLVGGDLTIGPGNGERVGGLVSATKEAMANAARHSGTPKVSVYVEVSAELVSVFVRDTGGGFDRSEIEATRKGLSGSIEGRMARIGGETIIRSTQGIGTNVELRLPAPTKGLL